MRFAIIPDRLFDLQFRDRPKGKDSRYFAVEYDRGNMPVARSNLHQSSYLRKFVGYASTYRQQLHRKHLGVEFFYVLNVTTSTERVDNLIGIKGTFYFSHRLRKVECPLYVFIVIRFINLVRTYSLVPTEFPSLEAWVAKLILCDVRTYKMVRSPYLPAQGTGYVSSSGL